MCYVCLKSHCKFHWAWVIYPLLMLLFVRHIWSPKFNCTTVENGPLFQYMPMCRSGSMQCINNPGVVQLCMTNIVTCTYLVCNILKQNRENEGCVFQLVEAAVNQCLIQVKHKRELGWTSGFQWQCRWSGYHFISQGRQVLDEIVSETETGGICLYKILRPKSSTLLPYFLHFLISKLVGKL